MIDAKQQPVMELYNKASCFLASIKELFFQVD
jgi:hypothetical protein